MRDFIGLYTKCIIYTIVLSRNSPFLGPIVVIQAQMGMFLKHRLSLERGHFWGLDKFQSIQGEKSVYSEKPGQL